VLTAANGRQGLDVLAKEHLDLIFIDYMMPIMDGAAMGQAVRRNPAYRNIPIIITSAVGEAPIRQHFSGFEAYLRKPFRIDDLLVSVKRLLAGTND